MTNKEALKYFKGQNSYFTTIMMNSACTQSVSMDEFEAGIKAIEALEAQENDRWIPITYHVVTDEERKEDCIPEEICRMLDCNMPDDNEEILVCHKNGWVDKDTCFIDEGYSLDSGWDWIEDVVAWMPLPDPYKGAKCHGCFGAANNDCPECKQSREREE